MKHTDTGGVQSTLMLKLATSGNLEREIEQDSPNWNALLNYLDKAKKLLPMPEEVASVYCYIEEMQQMEHEGRYA